MLPYFILCSEHLCQKVEVKGIFEGGHKVHSGHLIILRIIVGIFNFVQRVFFHKYVSFSAQRVKLLNFANLERVELLRKTPMGDLKDLCEVAVTEFLDGFKVIDTQGLGLLGENFVCVQAHRLVSLPVFLLACLRTVKDRMTLAAAF